MPYLIDGHNLIPNIEGLSLGDPDDEMKCIQRLQGFSRQVQTNVEVYFDQAPPGQTRIQRFGRVTAYFISQDKTADLAIKARLASLGGAVKNWTVVSSDREVVQKAKSCQARVLSSLDFAARLGIRGKRKEDASDDKWNPSLSSAEVEYWMEKFEDDEV
jgi:predicted RNA-binding protein with PIN domain